MEVLELVFDPLPEAIDGGRGFLDGEGFAQCAKTKLYEAFYVRR